MIESISHGKEVLQAERDWLEAHRKLDAAAPDRLMHPDSIQIKPDGALMGAKRKGRDQVVKAE